MPCIYGTTMKGFLLLVLFSFLLVPCLFLFLCWLMLTLFKAHAGCLHLLNALLRWSSSSFIRWWLQQTVLALCLRVLITLNFADKWWWLSQYKYQSVCVGFLYTNVRRELSGCGITIVTRKGIDPSALSSSVVNWMCGSLLLMCSRNYSFPAESMTTQVSSTYLFQILGGYWAVLMALVSKSSIKRLATMGLMVDPIAAPWGCSKNLPWN